MRQVQFLIDQFRAGGVFRARLNGIPERAQIVDIGGKFAVLGDVRHGANDEAAMFIHRQYPRQALTQQLALAFILDLLRNTDPGFLRQVDQETSRHADLGR